jgi:hypothetical protein
MRCFTELVKTVQGSQKKVVSHNRRGLFEAYCIIVRSVVVGVFLLA